MISPLNTQLMSIFFKIQFFSAKSIEEYDTGKVLWVEQGRKTEDLECAYDATYDSLTDVKQVSLDLWPAYEKATINKLPKAKMVYDRFHI